MFIGCGGSPTNDHLDLIKESFFEPHYYFVEHDGLRIGTYLRSASLTDDNEYEFRTTLTMPSSDGLTLATKAVYQFNSRPPYLLSYATRTVRAVAKERPYRVEQLYPNRNNDAENSGDKSSSEQYGLQDFFALELALMSKSESTDDGLETIAIPFHEIPNSTRWTIKSRSNESISVTSVSGDLATYSLEHGLPRLDLLVDDTGLSVIRIAFDDFDAFDLLPLHVAEDIRIPIDQPIESPRTVSALTVLFEFDKGERGPWISLLDAQGTLNSSTHTKTSTEENVDWEGETLDLQTARRLRSIIAEVVQGIDDPHLVVNALVAYVNRTLTYTNWNTLQSVEETLDQKIGDCTEFSQLFTALATAAELSARTVVGLAYHQSSQSFAIHAWNEVLLEDGSIRVIDPTWNQIQADATHIEFPTAYQHEIVRTLKNLRIKVLSVDYDSDLNT